MADKPTRFYVDYEDNRKIAALQKEHGEDWQDSLDCPGDILSRRNFDTAPEAQAFLRERVKENGEGSAEMYERTYVLWIADLREWDCEAQPFEGTEE